MNEDNKIFKTNEFSIEVSPVENTKQVKNVQYFSYDENSGLQLIHILMDGKPLDLPNGTEIRLSAVKLNNQNQKLIYTPEIVDPLKGIVSFVIPREFLGYQGQIRCGLYINFSNNQTMHVGYFYINMDVSDIDTNLTEFTEDFWQGWSEFEASSTAKMKELEQRIDEQTEIFNNADVYNKAEIEDKLEPFALRTDIDTLEIKKADKTNVEDLVTKKADKETLNTMISELNARISNIPKGNPSGTFATLADLKAKYPSGNGNVYVVSADNKWYYWSGSTWTAGGPYQPAELPDEGIGLPKFDAGVSKYRDGSSLTWTFGTINSDTGQIFPASALGPTEYNRMYSQLEEFGKGTKFTNLDKANFGIGVAVYSIDKTYIGYYGLGEDDHVLAQNSYVSIFIQRQDGTIFDGSYFNQYAPKITFKISDYVDVKQKNKNIVNNDTKISGEKLEWVVGDIDATGNLTQDKNRLTSQIFPVSKGTLIKIKNKETMKMSWALFDKDGVFISKRGYVNPYYDFLADDNYWVRLSVQDTKVGATQYITNNIEADVEIKLPVQDAHILETYIEQSKNSGEKICLLDTGIETFFGTVNANTGETSQGGNTRLITKKLFLPKGTKITVLDAENYTSYMAVYDLEGNFLVNESTSRGKDYRQTQENRLVIISVAKKDNSIIDDPYILEEQLEIQSNALFIESLKSLDKRSKYIGTDFKFLAGTVNTNTGELTDEYDQIGARKYIYRTNPFLAQKGTTFKIFGDEYLLTRAVYLYDKRTKEYLKAKSSIFPSTNNYFELDDDYLVVVAIKFKDNATITDLENVINKLEIRLMSDDYFQYLKTTEEQKAEIGGLERYELTNYVSSLSTFGNKIWGFSPSDNNEAGIGYGFEYSFDELGQRSQTNSFAHNLGHMNTSNYCQQRDSLLFSGGSQKLEGIFLLEKFSEKVLNASIDIAETINYPLTDVLANPGQPIWGPSNNGYHNLIYLMVPRDGVLDIVLAILGIGANDLSTLENGGGTFTAGKTDDEFNGTIRLLKTYTNNEPFDPEIDVIQDAYYFNGRIYTANGHDGIQYWTIELNEASSTFDVKKHQERWYLNNGDPLLTVNNGMVIRDGLLYTTLTVGNDVSTRKTYMISFKC